MLFSRARGLGSVSINVRITAVRKLAVEAADNGLLPPELASAITRVKGVACFRFKEGHSTAATPPKQSRLGMVWNRPVRHVTYSPAATNERVDTCVGAFLRHVRTGRGTRALPMRYAVPQISRDRPLAFKLS